MIDNIARRMKSTFYSRKEDATSFLLVTSDNSLGKLSGTAIIVVQPFSSTIDWDISSSRNVSPAVFNVTSAQYRQLHDSLILRWMRPFFRKMAGDKQRGASLNFLPSNFKPR